MANHFDLHSIPSELPILPIRVAVAFPLTLLPVEVSRTRSVKQIEKLWNEKKLIGLVTIKNHVVEFHREHQFDFPASNQIYQTGTVASIEQIIKLKNNALQVIFQGVERFKVEEWVSTEPYLLAQITVQPDIVEKGIELDALKMSLREVSKEIVLLTPNLPKDIIQVLDTIDDERHVFYFVATFSSLALAEKQRLLELEHLNEKYRVLLSSLIQEKEVLKLGKKNSNRNT
jgi:ATP-dependent Lon protease